MTPVLAGQNVAVYGLAKSGRAAIRLLLREGATVTAVDRASREQLGAVASELEGRGVRLHLAQDPAPVLRAASLIVVSPGVPLALPELEAARRAGIPVWGEVELASRFLGPAPMLGITGTNGKSTTTALTGALLGAAGRRVFTGGNLGDPLSDAALTDAAWDAYVVELSSFQLEGAQTLRCHGAALLNLTPDHVDRYPSHGAYGEAKARIFAHQQPGDFAVVNADDPAVVALAQKARVPVYGFTLRGSTALPAERLAHGGDGVFTFAGERYEVRSRALRGPHNLQNAMAATLLARLSGLCTPAEAARGLEQFGGLPHRIESVAVVDGVEWVNDSKATNVDATVVALGAFTGGVWLILGGRGKGAPYGPLVAAARGRVKGVLTIGEDAEAIEAAFSDEDTPVFSAKTLEGAVEAARRLARAGDVVLLSPACASYDQFRNFEHRGDTFKMLVRGRVS